MTLQEKYPGRLLPSFLLVGWPKTGSTSLASYLANHPQIISISEKEPNFVGHHSRTTEDYVSLFPDCKIVNCTNKMTFDGSISLVTNLFGATDAYRYFPDAKLVFLVRNPVDRAYSRFRMDSRKYGFTITFDEFVVTEIPRIKAILADFENFRELKNSTTNILEYQQFLHRNFMDSRSRYFFGSFYYYYIEPFLQLYPRSNIHVMSTYRLLVDPEHEVGNLFKFLGLESQSLDWESLKKNVYPPNEDMKPETRARLINFFKNFNQMFEDEMGQTFDLDK